MPSVLRKLETDFNSFPLFTKEESTDYLFGANNAWVSDIWAFWDFILRRHKTKLSGAEKKYDFLHALLEQAKYFYQAAETAPIKSQPLLYYYSFMNIAKIVINISVKDNDAPWADKKYMHGLYEKTGTNPTLSDSTVTCKLDANKASVAQLFLKVMGDVIVEGQKFNVKELLASCLGIHRAYSETYNQKEKFYRLDNPSASKEGKKLYFSSEIHDCSDNDYTDLNTLYRTVSDLDEHGQHTHCFIWKVEFERNKTGVRTKKDLYELANKIRENGIWGITNGEDVSLYISSSRIRLSAESIIYLLMFFFGSITRYNPHVFDELLSDKNMWLMSEFLKTQPKQFIYLVTYRVIGRNIRQSWMTKL